MELALTLPQNSSLPLYKQLAEAIKSAIADGKLQPGQKLPSSRALAESLAISRETASRSYAELASLGLIKVTAGSGVIVNDELSYQETLANTIRTNKHTQLSPAELSAYGKRLMDIDELAEITTFLRPEFNCQAPTLDDLPVKRWRELLQKAARTEDDDLVAYINDPFGYKPLREAIAAYLARRRAIVCSPEQIAVFNTTEGGSDLICRLLVQPGDFIAVENPGTPGVRMTFRSHGAQFLPIAVDQGGIVVDELRNRRQRVRLIYVTPSHHDPSGVVLTPQRRQELIEWATRSNAFIIEDDFDSEYRYGERPVPALKSLDTSDCVIYRYNFWRALYPLVRISFLVLPKRLLQPVWRTKSLTERDVPLLEQRALGMLIEEGHLERHMRRTLGVYSRRRIALVQALKREFGDDVTINPISAGLHVLVRFSPLYSEQQIMLAARAADVPLLSTRQNYLTGAVPNEFVIAFAFTPEEKVREMIARFNECIRQ
jgi:GntR family transcriptional regulator/MocR family aminotransferase